MDFKLEVQLSSQNNITETHHIQFNRCFQQQGTFFRHKKRREERTPQNFSRGRQYRVMRISPGCSKPNTIEAAINRLSMQLLDQVSHMAISTPRSPPQSVTVLKAMPAAVDVSFQSDDGQYESSFREGSCDHGIVLNKHLHTSPCLDTFISENQPRASNEEHFALTQSPMTPVYTPARPSCRSTMDASLSPFMSSIKRRHWRHKRKCSVGEDLLSLTTPVVSNLAATPKEPSNWLPRLTPPLLLPNVHSQEQLSTPKITKARSRDHEGNALRLRPNKRRAVSRNNNDFVPHSMVTTPNFPFLWDNGEVVSSLHIRSKTGVLCCINQNESDDDMFLTLSPLKNESNSIISKRRVKFAATSKRLLPLFDTQSEHASDKSLVAPQESNTLALVSEEEAGSSTNSSHCSSPLSLNAYFDSIASTDDSPSPLCGHSEKGMWFDLPQLIPSRFETEMTNPALDLYKVNGKRIRARASMRRQKRTSSLLKMRATSPALFGSFESSLGGRTPTYADRKSSNLLLPMISHPPKTIYY